MLSMIMAIVANIGCAKIQDVTPFPTSAATYSIQRMECSACDGNMKDWAKDEITAVLTERNAYDPNGGTPLTVTVFSAFERRQREDAISTFITNLDEVSPLYEASVSVELRTLDGRKALVTRSKHVTDADVIKGLGEDKGLEERTLRELLRKALVAATKQIKAKRTE